MKLEELYKEVYPKIFTFFYVRIGDRQTAEDLTQDVFFQAFKNYHTFSGNSTIETWIFGIAKNHLRNFYRKKKYRKQLLEKIRKHDVPEDSPEEQVMEKEEKRTLLDVIQQLEELPKEVVMLRIYGELSFNEISSLVNKSEGHTRIIFHRAKLKIQKELDDRDEKV